MTILARAQVILDGDTVRLTKSLLGAEAAMRQAGQRMQNIGRDMQTKITLPVMAVGGASVHMAAQFDESMRRMGGLVGIQQAVLDEWRDDIRRLAVEYGKSGSEAAEAMFFITSAGLRGSRAMETLEAALTGAAIGMGETKSVADAATSAMNAYATTGLTATRATEILAAGVRAGKLEAEALAPVMGRITGTASALRVSFADVVGTLAVFSRTGTDAAEGATQILAIMSSLLGTSKEGEDALRAVGLSLEQLRDVAAGPRGLINVMRILNDAFEGEQDLLKIVIPNLRAFRGVMNALAQDSATVDQVLSDVANSQGILSEALERAEGPAHALNRAMAAIKDTFIELGDVLIPVVVPHIQTLALQVRTLAQRFAAMNPVLRNIILGVIGVTAAMGPLLVVFGSLLKLVVVLKFSALIGAFKTMGILLAVGGPLLVGVGLLAAAFVKMKMDVAAAAIETEAATNRMKAAFGAVDPETAARRIERFDAVIGRLRGRAEELRRRSMMARAAQVGLADATATRATPAMQENAEKLGATADALFETIARMEEYKMVLEEVVAAAEHQNEVVSEPIIQKQLPWVVAAQDAMRGLQQALREAADMNALLGDSFDLPKAQAAAYEDAVNALVAAGVPFAATLDAQGTTLDQLAQRFREMQGVLDETERKQLEYNARIQEAEQLVANAITPQQRYTAQIETLNFALQEGVISQVQFAQASAAAGEQMALALGRANTATTELGRGMESIADQGLRAFVDFSRGAENAIGTFVQSALAQLQRLLIKAALVRLISKGSVGEIPALAGGGFLQPGQIGLVGEAGAELVQAGRQGLTVTPAPALASGGGALGENVTIPITLHVSALDGRSVAEFFRENEGLVSNTMLRAWQRSAALRRRLT